LENRCFSQKLTDEWLKFWMSGITDADVFTWKQAETYFSLIKKQIPEYWAYL